LKENRLRKELKQKVRQEKYLTMMIKCDDNYKLVNDKLFMFLNFNNVMKLIYCI